MGIYTTPDNAVEYIKSLEARIARLERQPRAGNTSIDTGTFSLKNPNTGNTVFYVGQLPNGDYGVNIYRDDGSLAFSVGRLFVADPSQRCVITNKSGASIVGDQFLSNTGEIDYSAEASIPIANDIPVVVSSNVFVDTHIIRYNVKSAQVKYYLSAVCSDGVTSAEVRLVNRAGSPLAGFLGATINPMPIPIGTVAETDFEVANGQLVFNQSATMGIITTVKVQARITAGTGTVSIRGWNLQQIPA